MKNWVPLLALLCSVVGLLTLTACAAASSATASSVKKAPTEATVPIPEGADSLVVVLNSYEMTYPQETIDQFDPETFAEAKSHIESLDINDLTTGIEHAGFRVVDSDRVRGFNENQVIQLEVINHVHQADSQGDEMDLQVRSAGEVVMELTIPHHRPVGDNCSRWDVMACYAEERLMARNGGVKIANALSQSPEFVAFAAEEASSEPSAVASSPASGTEDAEPADYRPGVVAAPQPHVYALVVGIEEYRSVTPTPGARQDAQAFAALLQGSLGVSPQNIQLLTDDDATRSDILAALAWLERNVSDDGRIYFFFSGHGSPNVETGESFLLPYEGQPETIDYSGIPLQQVIEMLETTRAQDVLAFVDSCFSGSGDRSALPAGARPLVPVQETEVAGSSSVALIASSAASEISGTTADGDRGLFTHHLLDALGEGRADMDGDGMISLEELQSYINPRVARDARRLNREQTPTISFTGDPEALLLMWGLPRN